MLISFVIPCYRSERTLPDVVDTIQRTMADRDGFEAELILVNDASPDNTWGTIQKLMQKYENITGVDLAKNSGQQCAIMAGMRCARGELITVSDDDGQTPIETVFEFYDKMVDGNYDVVCAKYTDRGKRGPIRKIGSVADNLFTAKLLDRPEDISLSVYFMAKKFVVEEMTKYSNAYPHIEGLLLRTTNNIGNVEVKQKERASGSSGYNFRKLFALWVDGLTTFSVKPLRVAVIFGMLMAIAGFIIIIALIVMKLTRDDIVIGWTSMIATTIMIGGMIMIVLGIIGEYIGRIYQSVNQNPQYVIREIKRNETRNE